MIKNFGTNKNYIKTIVQCTIKVKWVLMLNLRDQESILWIRNVDLWRNGKRVVMHFIKKTVLADCHFLLMQLYQPARNVDYGPVTSYISYSKTFSVPEKVQTILANFLF
jgi:hypothetical protein